MRQLFLCAIPLALFSSYAAAVKVEVLQTKLDHPWSLAFLPDNRGMLITLKGGQLRLWQPDKGLSDPLTGVPKVWANGQGGLLDVALAPDFERSRRVWLSFAEADSEGKAGTAVGYGRLSDDLKHLQAFQTVFRQQPKLSTGNHFGGRMVFDGHCVIRIPRRKPPSRSFFGCATGRSPATFASSSFGACSSYMNGDISRRVTSQRLLVKNSS